MGGLLHAALSAECLSRLTVARGRRSKVWLRRCRCLGLELQRYVTPLLIEVLNHSGPVPLADVAQYFSDVSTLHLNTTENGNGPGNSLVLPWIGWSRIKQIKEFPN